MQIFSAQLKVGRLSKAVLVVLMPRVLLLSTVGKGFFAKSSSKRERGSVVAIALIFSIPGGGSILSLKPYSLPGMIYVLPALMKLFWQ